MTYSIQCHFEAIELVVLDDLKIEKVKGLTRVKFLMLIDYYVFLKLQLIKLLLNSMK